MRAASVTIALFLSSLTMGDVFDMPDDLTSLETAAVGNPGNAQDMRYTGFPHYSPPFGAVGHTYRMG